MPLFDAFISHASEDKDGFVRELAERLRAENVVVWYDEFALKIGDSIRASIEHGLAQSEFAIVVLSPHFFTKGWTQWELDGILGLHLAKQRRILPIWHNINADELLAIAPSLAGQKAALSSDGIEAVVGEILSVVKPEGSALIAARDYVIENGWDNPPVISDDYWLSIATSVDADPMEPWWFRPPTTSPVQSELGLRLGHTALMESWQWRARDLRISQISHPSEVHQFLVDDRALLDACRREPEYAIQYAPQLALPGFGGPLEDLIAEVAERTFTQGGSPHHLESPIALRAPDYAVLSSSLIACTYIQGKLMSPPVQVYETIDYVAWLLSDASLWMSAAARALLTKGSATWGAWTWTENQPHFSRTHGFEPIPVTGALQDALYASEREEDDYTKRSEAREDLEHRLGFSANLLSLPETGAELVARFDAAKFIDTWFRSRARRAEDREKDNYE